MTVALRSLIRRKETEARGEVAGKASEAIIPGILRDDGGLVQRGIHEQGDEQSMHSCHCEGQLHSEKEECFCIHSHSKLQCLVLRNDDPQSRGWTVAMGHTNTHTHTHTHWQAYLQHHG